MVGAAKRCHYEVLGISRDATADEIRSAYRRLALQLHPDKQAASGVSPADATAAFQDLLHSYEVLSDPKERAWYDSHRSQILFADQKSTRSSSSAVSDIDFYGYFSASCFSGYSDSDKGFFKVYGDVFSKIHEQELHFAEKLGLGVASVPLAPLIGNLDSPYAQVTAFYNYWLGFSTVMDFAWVDEYDASLGPNRRSRRFMEEENKKIRKKAKRERNELVRGLAAFAKKRDKRVIDMMVKKSQQEEKRRAEEKAKKKEEEKRKLERMRMYEEPEWAKIDANEEEHGLDDEFDDGKKQKEKGSEEFYCVACNKRFKSDKQWKNHAQSKKHKEKVAELKDAFEQEEEVFEDFDDKVEEVRVGFDYETPPEDDDSNGVDELCDELRDEVVLEEKAAEKDDDSGDLEVDDDKVVSEDETSVLETMAFGRKNKKNCRVVFHETTFCTDLGLDDDEEEGFTQSNNRRKGRKNRGRRRRAGGDAQADALRGEIQQDDAESQDQRDVVGDCKNSYLRPPNEFVAGHKGSQGDERSQKQKKHVGSGKSTEKMELEYDGKNSSKGWKHKGTSKAPKNACGTCGEIFESRNKMFAHLGETGHAMLKSR